MIWSEQELANIAVAGKEIAIERVMKQLDNPENEAIFDKENFSLLWGVLGIAGVEGTSESAKEKIWQALKDNGVVDAYDKGILADFSQRLAAPYKDSRLRVWLQLDNFRAGQYFEKVILNVLSKTNATLEAETIPYCLNGIKLVSSLAKNGLSSRLKTYLEGLRKQDMSDDESGAVIAAVFEKEMILRKLADVIVTSKRKLKESEKDYLYYYFREAVNSGFEMSRIGLNDQTLSHLMSDEDDELSGELETHASLMRNADIMELISSVEEKYGFFEECAAKFIHADKSQIPAMIEKCNTLIHRQKSPKGLVFALELVNLGQIKSAVLILKQLAQKGEATEAACFMHRLLPNAKGAESFLLGILQLNLRNQHSRNPWGDNSFFFEYITRRYIQAAKAFAEQGFYKEAAALLQELVLGKWFEDKDDLIKDFLGVVNWLLAEDKSLQKDLASSIKILHLQIFNEGDTVYVGTEADNPITAMRHRLEQSIKTATTFDVSKVFDKISKAESSTYDKFKTIKQALSSKKDIEEEEKAITDELPPIAFEKDEAKVTATENIEEKKVVSDEMQVIEAEPAKSDITQEVSASAITEVKKADETAAVKDNNKQNVLKAAANGITEKGLNKLSSLKEKINISNTLKDNIHGIGDGFDKLKQATTAAFKKAENKDKNLSEERVKKAPDNDMQTTVDVAQIDTAPIKPEEKADDMITAPLNVETLETKEPKQPDTYDEATEQLPDIKDKEEDAFPLQQTEPDNVTMMADNKPEVKPLAAEIKSWEEEAETTIPENDENNKLGAKNKIISNILKIKTEDLDKHFEAVKKITSSAVKKAENTVAEVKKRVEETNITQSQSVHKIKNIASKLKLFKKK